MAREVIATLRIDASSWYEAKSIRDKIHERLIGNEDYIKSNIVLYHEDKSITVHAFKGCTTNLFKVLGA